ncbi:MAG: hypothetical protein OHK0029_38060 [Armatimonadaceae bacterium]
MRIIHEPGRYIAIEENGVERLRYCYQLPDDPAPSAPKPYFHPIRTPEGIEVTADAPLDHFWHRGIWFAWKYINGVNYWEENQEIVGRQVTLEPPTVAPLGALGAVGAARDSVRLLSTVAWRDTVSGTEETRLLEERQLEIHLKAEGTIVLDWLSRHQAQEAVLLDRTPYTTWGGYSGLAVRLTQALQRQKIVFDDGTESDNPIGEPHSWGALEGQLDTGKDRFVRVVFMPSPQSRRFPEPFYGRAKAFYNFFGPAPLFHEPLPLEAQEILEYRVRVLILCAKVATKDINKYYNEWLEQEGASSAYADEATP